MNVLYLGAADAHSTSLARARALMRAGHRVDVFDIDAHLPRNRWLAAWHFRTGYRLLLAAVARAVQRHAAGRRYDLVWVNGGQAVGASLVHWLRTQVGPVVNYNNDDPFGERDGRCWDSFKRAVPAYDLLCVLREVNVAEARSLGARAVLRAWMSYDPVAHRPRKLTGEQEARWSSEVVFVGTWMPERGPFLRRLVELGVPLTIRGDHWTKAPEWPALARVHRGPGALGDDYVLAIQSSRLALGLLSKGNRDLHTSRSLEIPFIGSVLCAERTREHQDMYVEDREAVFWSTPEECARQCHRLLRDEETRQRIALAGRRRVLNLKLSTDDVVRQVLEKLREGGAGAVSLRVETPAQFARRGAAADEVVAAANPGVR